MKTTSPFNTCVECNEAITNPICPDCLAVRMQIMVGEYDQEVAGKIKGFDMDGDTTCILCGKNMGLCAHCFSKDIHEFLKEKKPEIAKEFLGRFDFELRENLVDF